MQLLLALDADLGQQDMAAVSKQVIVIHERNSCCCGRNAETPELESGLFVFAPLFRRLIFVAVQVLLVNTGENLL
jgi:hypothetical protein